MKTKLVIIANSHCETNSKRELFIDALSKVVNVTKLGNCYNAKKIHPEKLKKELGKYPLLT